MIELLINVLLALVGLALGGYIVLFGRQALWATLGIISLAASANLLAILVAGADSGRDLFELEAWGLLGVTVAVGSLGIVLGRYRRDLAANVIGFIAGANIALWLYDISAHVVTAEANLPEETAVGIGVAILVIGGLLGIWLVRWDREEALILLSVLVGAEMINDALRLSETRSITAILLLSLALAGVLAQYGAYLREQKASSASDEPEPVPSSLTYFQNIELS